MSDNYSTHDYTVHHSPTMKEPTWCREARVLRELGKYVNANEAEIDPATATKLRKILHTRLINLMDAARAEP